MKLERERREGLGRDETVAATFCERACLGSLDWPQEKRRTAGSLKEKKEEDL